MADAPKHSSKPKARRFVLRPYRRVPTQRVLYYLSGKCVGKGVVTNLSQSGMRVRGEHAIEQAWIWLCVSPLKMMARQ